MIKLSEIAYIDTRKSILPYFQNCMEELPKGLIFVPKDYSVAFRGIRVVEPSFINEGADGFFLMTKMKSSMSRYSIAFMLNSIPSVYALLYDTENMIFKNITKKRLQICLIKDVEEKSEPPLVYIEQIIEHSLSKGLNKMSDFDKSMYHIWTDLMDAIALELYVLDCFYQDNSVSKAWAELYKEMITHENPLQDITSSLLSPNSEVMNRKRRLHVTISKIGELLKRQ